MRRRRAITQWASVGAMFGTGVNLVNATTAAVDLFDTEATSLNAPNFSPARLRIERIVGELVFGQQASTANCAYRVGWGIGVFHKTSSAAGFANPDSAVDAQFGWMIMKHAVIYVPNDTTITLQANFGYSWRLGEGFFHCDTRVRRVIRPDQTLTLCVIATQFAGTSQAIQFTPFLRALVSRIV